MKRLAFLFAFSCVACGAIVAEEGKKNDAGDKQAAPTPAVVTSAACPAPQPAVVPAAVPAVPEANGRIAFCDVLDVLNRIPAIAKERAKLEDDFRKQSESFEEERAALAKKAKSGGFATEEEFAKAQGELYKKAGTIQRQFEAAAKEINQHFDAVLRSVLLDIKTEHQYEDILDKGVVLAGGKRDVTEETYRRVNREFEKSTKWTKEATPAVPPTPAVKPVKAAVQPAKAVKGKA